MVEYRENGATEGEDEHDEMAHRVPFEITDNLVILLLIVFTVIIGIWWFLNLYMGRWVH